MTLPDAELMLRRRQLLQVIVVGSSLITAGCVAPWTTKKEELTESELKAAELQNLIQSEERPRLVGDVAQPRGLNLAMVESIGLVNGLAGTGGDPKPSSQRERLLRDMQGHAVKDPNTILAADFTAMVAVRGIIPPGAMKGDRFDLEVVASRSAEATSLRGGWLMPTSLTEMRVLGERVRTSDTKAYGQGSLIIAAQVDANVKDEEKELKAIIPGGGVLIDARPLSLYIPEQFSHVMTAGSITKAINEQFFIFDGLKKRGVAIPKTDSSIEISMNPRYRLDPYHYMDVLMNIGFAEPAPDRAARLSQASMMMNEPTTARKAALQLEGMGKEGIRPLKQHLANPNPEIRFYSAQALAYMDDPDSIPVLQQLAIEFPAFRAYCLFGLTILEHYDAYEALVSLLEIPDPEVRYGALLAIRERNSSDPLVVGDRFGSAGSYLEVPTYQSPMIAISLEGRPEIVSFGPTPVIAPFEFYYLNPRIMLRYSAEGNLRVSNFAPGQEDKIQVCAPDLRSLTRAIVEVGGGYGEIVSAVHQLGKDNKLPCPVLIEPKPRGGRVYDRNGENARRLQNSKGIESSMDALPLEEINTPVVEEIKYSWWNPRGWFASKPAADDSATR